MKKECKDHLGNVYSSLADMCRFYGITESMYRRRIKNNWSLEKILTTPKIKRSYRGQYTDHLGNSYNSLKEMCKTYGIYSELFLSRIRKGHSLEEALTSKKQNAKTKCQDHLGNNYNSIADMCKTYDISTSAFYSRTRNGWTLEEILTTPMGFARDGSLRSNKYVPRFTDHEGNKYFTFKEMCEAWGQNDSAVYQRINKFGYSLEEALTKETRCYDHLGKEYISKTEMCNAYGLDKNTFAQRIKKGWSLKKALTEPMRDWTTTDHLGKSYPTLKAMCNAYGISLKTFNRRKNKGMSLKECLTNKKRNKIEKVIDHLGNEYKSINQMAKKYNIPYQTLVDRLNNRNWDIKKALLTPIQGGPYYDHLGNKYERQQDLFDAWNISEHIYYKYLKKGESLEDILTKHTLVEKKIIDHHGHEYKSYAEMCNFYGITQTAFWGRLRLGWELKYCLEGKPEEQQKGKGYNKSCCDHLGNTYACIADMARKYDIDSAVIRSRLALGWNIKDALTTPVNKHDIYIDHLGNQFNTLKEMCETYGITSKLYCNRIRCGWSTEEILTIPRNMYIGEYRVAECLKRLNIMFYHDCSIKTIFSDLGLSIDWKDFLSELQNRLKFAGHNWSKQKIQKLRPDFVLYTDKDNRIRGVIEFDGEQHQNFVEYFFKTIEEFYKRSNTDFVKQSLWEYIKIPMLRIRHDQVDMIDDMVKDFIDHPQNYIYNHNTYLSEDEYWSILKEQKAQIEMAFAIV